VLLHGLLLAWIIQDSVIPMGDAHMDGSGTGDALVVDFVAVSRPKPTPTAAAVTEAVKPTSANKPADEAGGKESSLSLDPAHVPEQVISKSGELVPSSITPTAASASGATASAAASGAGSPTDDLHTRYHAALRMAIAKTWHDLTERPFPSGCTLDLSQGVGGTVTASSAAHCSLSREDRLQLEAAALMAQPLPYSGYEAVFAPVLQLHL